MRHAVACFLTRGDLWQSWEKGAPVFDELLLDADPAINAGNWMWLSCSCFFYQYFRVYGPVSFGKKYDKEGVFIKKYLPALRDMPAKYVYEPWLAPLDVQKEGEVRRQRRLPRTYRGPRGRVQGVHREDRRRIQGTQGRHAGRDKTKSR